MNLISNNIMSCEMKSPKIICLIIVFQISLSGCNTTKTITRFPSGSGKIVSFNDPHIQYEGRIGQKDSEAAVLYWSGTIVRLSFHGTSIRAVLQDYNGQNYFNVIIDNEVLGKIRIDSTKKVYILAENLSEGNHTVELFKRTQINKEYKRGFTWFYGFQLQNGSRVLPQPPLKKKKIEFYGNSITCGHAIEDTSGGDSGAAVFENNYLSYAALTARHYDAQYSCISISGIGLMAGFRKVIMPEVYDLLNPFDSGTAWNFSKYIPGIVVINLLQNDEAVIAHPEGEPFKKRFGTTLPDENFIIGSYEAFIQKLRKHYPDANIICVLGSMGITRKGSKWPGYVKKAVANLRDKKIYTHFFKYKGTPGHPRVKDHEVMAKSLIRFIDSNKLWQ